MSNTSRTPDMPTNTVATYFGASFILYCIALILFGIICAQCYAYWAKSKDDPPTIRYCVLFVFVLESTHTAAILHFLYYYLIDAALNPQKLTKTIWTDGAIIIFSVSVIVLVQGFYTYRIYRLSNRSRLAVSASIALLFLRTVPAVVAAALMIGTENWMTMLNFQTLRIMIDLSLCMNTVTDAILTAFFVFYLYKCRTSFDRTQDKIKTLMKYTVNTGALAILGSLAVLVMFLSSRTLVFTGMYAVVSKVYANSMLAQLNTRESMQELSSESQCPSQTPLTGSGDEMGRRTRRRTEIHVQVVEQTMTDSDVLPFSPETTF